MGQIGWDLLAMGNSMSDWSAVMATLKAAHEAEARLTVSIRHSEKIGALPPKLMSAQRDLYEAIRLLASAISHLEESTEQAEVQVF